MTLDSFHIGAKALIFNSQEKILLLQRDHPIKKIYWDLPGGRVQKEESVKETLIRELKEEIGLDTHSPLIPFGMYLTDIRIPTEQNVGVIFSIFTCKPSMPFQPILSKEHFHFEWLTPLQLSERLMQYPEEFIEKLLHF